MLDENNQPVSTSDIGIWGKWFSENNGKNRILKHDRIGDILVSTVFLGIDHGLCWSTLEDNRPILWETMIFGGVHDEYQERYRSHEEALEGHRYAVQLVKASLEQQCHD